MLRHTGACKVKIVNPGTSARELERLLKARDEYEKRQLEIAERRRRRQGRKSDKTFPEHWKEPDKEVYEPVIKCTQIAAASPSGAAAASAIIPMAAPSAVAMQPPCSLAAQGQSALKAAAEAGQEMVSHLPSGEVPEVQAAAATRPSSSNGFSLGGQLRSTGGATNLCLNSQPADQVALRLGLPAGTTAQTKYAARPAACPAASGGAKRQRIDSAEAVDVEGGVDVVGGRQRGWSLTHANGAVQKHRSS